MLLPEGAGSDAPASLPRDAAEALRDAAWAMVGDEADGLRLARRAKRMELAAAGWRALSEDCGVVAFAFDRQGVLHWATPAAAAILTLPAPAPVPGAGRRLAEGTCHLDHVALEAEAGEVLDHGAPRERRVTTHGGTEAWLMRLLPYAGPDGMAAGVVATFRPDTGPARDPSLGTLVEELNHRIRNMAQVVLSIANSTRRHADSLDEFGRSFSGRILAMGRTQDMVAQCGREGLPLHDLVRRQLDPYANGETSLVLDGPVLRLTPKAALSLDLVLHELATNAAKYGALSVGGGQVRVGWAWEGESGAMRLLLRWQESGGPAVPPGAGRRGFGSDLIERQVRTALDGTVTLDFAPAGMRATIALPTGAIADGPATH